MDPSAQLSIFNAWRHPGVGGMGVSSVAGVGAIAGMDLTQAAYRYNQNMMEYYTCKSELIVDFGLSKNITKINNNDSLIFKMALTLISFRYPLTISFTIQV